MVADLFFVDKNYVSKKDFVSAREVNEPFQPTPADLKILNDKSNYRVYELQGRLQGRNSYFHKSVGGYSAVRPRRFEQLFEYQIDKKLTDLGKMIDPQTMTLTKSVSLLDALNVKYLIVPTESGDVSITNPFINGNAWFVSKIQNVNSADEEMKALDNLDTKVVAVRQKEKNDKSVDLSLPFKIDSTATIKLTEYLPNHLTYVSNNKNNGFAVFSEMYYANGWKATIDGKEAKIYRVDYVLTWY